MSASTEFGFVRVLYSLRRRVRDGLPEFQWQRDDGVPLSPIMSSLQQSIVYQKTMAMLTEDEWLIQGCEHDNVGLEPFGKQEPK